MSWLHHSRRALILAVVCTACGGGSTEPKTSTTTTLPPSTPTGGTTVPVNTVIATNESTFNPAALTVAPGTTVTFTFQGTTHNVTFSGTSAPANIPNTANASVARTFPSGGVFAYTCTLHSGMNGSITVQ